MNSRSIQRSEHAAEQREHDDNKDEPGRDPLTDNDARLALDIRFGRDG